MAAWTLLSAEPAAQLRRRELIATAALATGSCGFGGLAWADERVRPLLAAGGVAIAFRHALAPGTFDPEGFRLDDCSTQRNLNDEGRAQARRIGEWFRAQGLAPARVRSSPWCRCVDTAMLAFGRAEPWAALSSPRASSPGDAGASQPERSARLAEAKRALAGIAPGRFEAWVTHQFVLQDLTARLGEGPQAIGSAEALVLRAQPAAGAVPSVQVLARAALY